MGQANTKAADRVDEMVPDLEELVRRARALQPLLREEQQACEERGHPGAEVARALRDAGLFRMLSPRAYGGYQMPLPSFYAVIMEIARGCPSTGWWYALGAAHAVQVSSYLEKEGQDEVFAGGPDFCAPWSFNADRAIAMPVDGGYRVSGKWAYCSGAPHADFFMGGMSVPDIHGRTASRETSWIAPTLTVIVPKGHFTVLDDWGDMLGMRGSGSKTLIFDKVFVPEHRIQAARDMMEGKSAGFGLYPDSKIFYTPYRPYFASGFSSISLGIAERMLEAFKEKTRNRVRAYTGASVGTATPALMRLAESTHQVAAARALLEKTWEDHREHGEARRYPSPATLTAWRTNQAYVVKLCVEAVDRLFGAAGAGAWFETNEMQRLFRDSHMTAAHAYTDYDVCSQILGRQLMGMEPDPTMI